MTGPSNDPMAELESRLRAAYTAKAETVHARDLRPLPTSALPAGTGTPLRRTARRLGRVTPLLVAAVVVAVVLGSAAAVTLLSQRHHNEPARPTPTVPSPNSVPESASTPAPTTASSSSSSTTTSQSSNPQVVLRHGQVGSRAQIPWGDVGSGWTLALWAKPSAPAALVLINPVGGRYVIASFPAGSVSLADWSGDRRRALLRTPVGSSSRVDELDLATGSSHLVTTRALRTVQYTKPSGLAVVYSDAANRYHRIDRNGALELTYPDVGAILGDRPLFTPDGSRLVFATETQFVVVSNSGAVVMRVAAAGCQTLRWWTTDVVLGRCSGYRIPPYLRAFPITGRQPSTVTAPRTVDRGDIDAVHVPSGTVATKALTCGLGTMQSVVEDGLERPFDIPGIAAGTPERLIGASPSALYFTTHQGCDQANGLYSYDPATGSLVTLLGGSLTGGVVYSAILDEDVR